MMKWVYNGPRRNFRGIWLHDGIIIDNPTKPSNMFKAFKGKGKGEATETIKEEESGLEQADNEVYEALRKKGMKELRKIGKKYNAYDTSKDELAREIMDKAPIEELKQIMRGD